MKAVNLLPSDQRSAPKPGGSAKAASSGGDPFGAYVVLGALALAVVGLAAFVLAGNTIKDRKSELARVTAEATATQAKADALKPYAEFQSLAASRVATVTGLAQSRFDWDRTLQDLSKAIPANVHLKSLKGSVASGTGASANPLRGAVQSPAIELSGCTDTHKSVATLMSRLRAVRGVSRVSLSKSDKGAVQLAPQLAASSGATAGALCKGNPPSFELVMFFERSALPAAALPNAAAAAAAPAAPADPAGAPSQIKPPAVPETTNPSTTPNGTQPAPAPPGVRAP